MTFPEVIHEGADGYETMRLERYDLTEDEWIAVAQGGTGGTAEIAISVGGGTPRVWTEIQAFHDGSLGFYTMTLLGIHHTEFDTAAEAMAHHEELAAPITERIAIMKRLGVGSLQEGAL